MVERVSGHRSPASERVTVPHLRFRASEAARVVGVSDLDYRQLARLLDISAGPVGADTEPGTWRSVNYLELLGLVEVVRLCVDVEALRANGSVRLSVNAVSRAVERLRSFGLAYPLLQTRLWREGRRVMASLDGVTFEIATGQLSMESLRRRPARVRRLRSADKALQERLDQAWNALGVRGPDQL